MVQKHFCELWNFAAEIINSVQHCFIGGRVLPASRSLFSFCVRQADEYRSHSIEHARRLLATSCCVSSLNNNDL